MTADFLRTPSAKALSAETLGQIALIQSMVFHLPDADTIFRFVCRGLNRMPGIGRIGYRTPSGETAGNAPPAADEPLVRRFPLRLKDAQYGEVWMEVSDPARFDPYLPYVENLCFMLAVILEERRQRQLIDDHQRELERHVRERTQQLVKEMEVRSRAEAALKASEERLRLAMEAAEDGLWDWNVQTGEMYWSPRCYTMLGHEPDAFPMNINKWLELVHPDDRDAAWSRMRRKLEGEEGSFAVEFRCSARDGSWRWFIGRGRPVAWDGGQVSRMLGTYVDITDRKAAAQSVAERERRLRNVFKTNPDPMVVYDGTGRPKYLNRAFTQVFGWEYDELKDGHIPFVPEDQQALTQAKIREVYESDKTVRFETRRLTKDGRMLDMIVSAAASRDAAGNWTETVVNLTDITERKRLAQQLQQSQKLEAIGTLTGGIAHDFNNILSIIIGNAEIALDDIQSWHPAYRHLEKIKLASLRAKDVVRQLLSFSRKGEQRKKPLRIQDILEESLQLMRATIPTTIEIDMDTAPDLKSIEADPTQIHQVIINLCTNAAHAMEKNGGVLEVRLANLCLPESAGYPDSLPPGQYVQLRVRDTGCGIDPTIKDRIFDPYFTTKESGKGSGIGLSVVHGIVGNHNGAIAVESEVGVGTTVSVWFPAIEAVPQPEAPATGLPHVGQEKILFVDDEPALAAMVQTSLERLGYRVEIATDPVTALAVLKERPEAFDLLITDMTMPKLTGAQLIAQALALRPDLPTILCTGYSEKMNPQRARELGIGLYLEKPFRQNDLAQAVRSVLDAHRIGPSTIPASSQNPPT